MTTSAHDRFEEVAEGLAPLGVTTSTVFGKPAYKDAAGHSFACLYLDGLACRLIADTVEFKEAMALPGAVLFHPSADGDRKPMKDWVVIPLAYADQWPHFADAAYHRPPRH